MTIISLTDVHKNFEEIRLSQKKIFKYKNEYTTDFYNLFSNDIEDVNSIITENFPLDGDTSYGLVPLFSWSTSKLKESNGNTQQQSLISKKNINGNINVFSDTSIVNNARSFENISSIRPNLNNISQADFKKIELNSNYFGIKRLQQNLTPFSNVLVKKKIVNNLYKSTKNLSDAFFSQQFNYSFYNYNCFNFFNIQPSIKIKNDQDATLKNKLINNSHKNMLVYSNKQLGSNINNNFISMNKLKKGISINFWINPKRKAYVNKKYNPGCILSLPNIVSIYLTNDDTDNFKILCQFHADSNKLSNNPNIVYQLESTSSMQLNTWNNVSVVLNNNDGFTIQLRINDKNFDELKLNSSLIFNECPVLFIGNKINNETNEFWGNNNYLNIQNYFFNQNNYLDYHLKLEELVAVNQNQISIELNSKIFDKVESFNYSLQSQSLNAELYGITIFNNNINFTNLYEYAKGNNDSNKSNLLNNSFLAFYIPCVYISEMVKRKGYINLGTRDDIAYRSVVNPYFSHKIYGHELSIESFVRDIINLRLPMIYGMNGDEYSNSLINNDSLTSSFINNDKRAQEKFKIIKDFTVNNKNVTQVLNQVMTSQIGLTDSAFTKGNDSFQYNNLIYRNNFILPCDNGKSNIDLTNIFNLSSIKNLIGNSLTIFYNNQNPHHINLSTLYTNSEQYSYLLQDDQNLLTNQKFFDKLLSNDKIYNITFTNVTNENCLSKIFIDKNNSNHIQNTFFSNIKNTSLSLNTQSLQNILNPTFIKLKQATDTDATLTVNAIFKNIDQKYEASLSIFENKTFTTKESRNYTNYFNSHYAIEGDLAETHSILFEISNVLYSSKIRPNTIEIRDVDLSGTGGALNIKLKDNGKTLMYRADCDGVHATWSHIGHAFYADGFVNVLHPGLSNFGENNFIFNLQGEHSLYTQQIDIPIKRGDFNESKNKTYIKGLKPSNNLSDLESTHFVYITGVNLHDENMNIVAKANFAQPIVKRTNDRYNIRLKMDF